MMDNKQNILVVGLGYRTGLAAANFLASLGKDVTVSDTKSREELRDVLAGLDRAVKVITGPQDPSILDRGFDCIILSPGVPQKIQLIMEAVKRGVPVISEIELAWYYLKGKTIGITGTDGKSTTTALCAHVFSRLGYDSRMAGNIGIPLISVVNETVDESVTVIELSSFQLETVKEFKPHVSTVLNITPDHLDRYDGMDEYSEAKFRIAMNQGPEDLLVINADDERVVRGAQDVKCRVLSFSLTDENADCFHRDGEIYIRHNGRHIPVLRADDMKIMGLHNVQNAMAALLMTADIISRMGKEPGPVRMAEAVSSFPGLRHRMEKLGIFEGREFINDSKATTVGAVEMAVKSIQGKAVFIIGGRTKGDDYTRLRKMMESSVRAVVIIGESKDYFSEIFQGFDAVTATDLDDAIVQAMKLSSAGDSVVLSPACASFDMFTSYEERGDRFRESFIKLTEGALAWT